MHVFHESHFTGRRCSTRPRCSTKARVRDVAGTSSGKPADSSQQACGPHWETTRPHSRAAPAGRCQEENGHTRLTVSCPLFTMRGWQRQYLDACRVSGIKHIHMWSWFSFEIFSRHGGCYPQDSWENGPLCSKRDCSETSQPEGSKLGLNFCLFWFSSCVSEGFSGNVRNTKGVY